MSDPTDSCLALGANMLPSWLMGPAVCTSSSAENLPWQQAQPHGSLLSFPFPNLSHPMTPEEFTRLIGNLCQATGMSPAMLYNCIGATLGANGALPVSMQQREEQKIREASAEAGAQSSDAQSELALGDTQKLMGGAPGEAHDFLEEAELLEESTLLNDSSTQISGSSSVRAAPCPNKFGGERIAQMAGWDRVGSHGSQAPHSRAEVAESPSSEAAWSDGVKYDEPKLENRLAEARSVVSHVSAGSNVWSPTLSPMISPILSGRLPDFSPSFGPLERLASFSPSSAFSPLERGETIGGFLPMDKAGSFSLAEIFTDIGEGAMPSVGSPVHSLSLGSLAAANASTFPTSSHDLPPGSGIIGVEASDTEALFKGDRVPRGVVLGKRKCDNRSAYNPIQEQSPATEPRREIPSGEVEATLAPSLHLPQATIGPLGILLRLGSEALPMNANQRSDTPAKEMSQARTLQQQQVHGESASNHVFQGGSWQSSESSPEVEPLAQGSWHLQLEDASSPSGGTTSDCLDNSAHEGVKLMANQEVGTPRERTGPLTPRQEQGGQGKRVRKGRNKVANVNSSIGETESKAASPNRLPSQTSPRLPPFFPPPLSCPLGLKQRPPLESPRTSSGSQGRRPEIEAILRKAHSQSTTTSPASCESKKKKTPEEILREAFQASMAAKAAKDPHAVLGIKRGPCTEPQALAARARRERVNARMRVLQNLVPGAGSMTTENFLLEAVQYINFLLNQVADLSEQPSSESSPSEEAFRPGSASESKIQLLSQSQEWPRDPELLRRGVRVMPVAAILTFAGEGGPLDRLLVGLGPPRETDEAGEECDMYDLDDF